MEHVFLFMVLFSGHPDAPKVTTRHLQISLDECWAWIKEVEPAPPGRRAYCAKVKIDWNNPNRACWYSLCENNFG